MRKPCEDETKRGNAECQKGRLSLACSLSNHRARSVPSPPWLLGTRLQQLRKAGALCPGCGDGECETGHQEHGEGRRGKIPSGASIFQGPLCCHGSRGGRSIQAPWLPPARGEAHRLAMTTQLMQSERVSTGSAGGGAGPTKGGRRSSEPQGRGQGERQEGSSRGTWRPGGVPGQHNYTCSVWSR